MKEKLVTSLRLLLGLLLIAALVWAAYIFFALVVRWISSLRSELATAIIASAATILISLLSLFVSKFFERRDGIQRELRLKKVPVYEQLISFIFGVLQQGKPGYPALSDEVAIRTYTTLTENVIVWGSDNVLKAFGDFRVASLQLTQAEGLPRVLVALEDLMLVIRKDLGYKNTKISRGDVLRLFMNDLDQQRKALELTKSGT